MNTVMKFLTGFTIIMMIPNIVSGIYGMNIPLPFQAEAHAFSIVSAITAGACLLAGWSSSRSAGSRRPPRKRSGLRCSPILKGSCRRLHFTLQNRFAPCRNAFWTVAGDIEEKTFRTALLPDFEGLM
jgi:hypothetical protein